MKRNLNCAESGGLALSGAAAHSRARLAGGARVRHLWLNIEVFSVTWASRSKFYPFLYLSEKAEYRRTLANKDAARERSQVAALRTATRAADLRWVSTGAETGRSCVRH